MRKKPLTTRSDFNVLHSVRYARYSKFVIDDSEPASKIKIDLYVKSSNGIYDKTVKTTILGYPLCQKYVKFCTN